MAVRDFNLDEVRAARAERQAQREADVENEREGELVREQAERYSGDLRAFIRAAWPILEPATEYRHNWHIDAIAEHLEAAYRRDIRRLIINIPPRRMKSLTVSVLGPAWRWTQKPEERFLTASYAEKLATDHATATRTIIQSAWYRARWGHLFQLTTDQNVKTWYRNDRRGYRMATSVGGAGTGFGGDVIVIDDPHNTQEATGLSDVSRQAAIVWHDQTISTRFNDPKTGVEILVMQRLHEGDLTGHLLARDEGEWTHLCLPEEYEPRLMITLPGSRTRDATCPPVRHVDVVRKDESGEDEPADLELQGDPRAELGQLLWPEHAPQEIHDETKRTLGAFGVAGQLQQRPAPAEGGVLKRAYWRYYPPDTMPPVTALFQSWDTSWKAKTSSDFVVGQVWGIVGANRYLLRQVRGRWGLVEATQQLRDLYRWVEELFPVLPHTIYIENTANGPDIIAALRNEIPGILPVKVDGDKVQRAQAVAPQLESGNVYVPGRGLADGTGPDPSVTPAWVQEFIGECAGFPNAANDDQVDAMTQLLLQVRGLTGNLPRKPRDDEDRDRRAATHGLRTQVF